MSDSRVVQPEGNYYDKYNSGNPIVKWMMKHFFADLDEMLKKAGEVMRILEAGCGEGEVTSYIARKYGHKCQIEAFDISEKVIRGAQKKYDHIKFRTGDIYNIRGGGYNLVVCCEVLEHLERPERALKELLRATDKYVILSVPREPVWCILNMVRGKYLKKFGNTPGHIQHWSTREFVKFLKSNGAEVISLRKPLPWTMVLIRKK